MKKSICERVFDFCNYVLLGLLTFSTLYPFIYVLSMSLSSLKAASVGGLHLYPIEVSFEAYKMVFGNEQFLPAYANTLYRTIFGTALALIVTLLYAYAISRKTLPFRKFFTVILIVTMVFSVGKVPMYMSLKSLGLLNNRLVYILPSAIAAYNVIVIKSYFQSLPEELHEAAMVDGANEFKTFFKIILPLSKPIIMTVLLWVAVSQWNAWYDSVMYINDNDKIVAQALLQRIIQQSSINSVTSAIINPDIENFTPETVKSATIVVTILPILLLYPFVQKYFVKGITLGAVKG